MSEEEIENKETSAAETEAVMAEPEAQAGTTEISTVEETVLSDESEKKAKATGSSKETESSNSTDTKKAETAEDLLKSDLEGLKIRKAKGSKNISSGIVNVLATFNNTKVTFTDTKGNVISWSSAGKCNFRGSRKSTAYAAQVVTQDAGRVAVSHGMKDVIVKLNGPGMGRDSAVRALQSLGIIVTEILDVTPVPHNGCRPPKRRRV